MDAGTLRAWTRFADKGGIGQATAVVDCPATGADDLMFMAGEDIVVLRPLPGAVTKGDPSGPFLGFCEGVVGRFNASQVRFHGRLKKPVVVRKQSTTTTATATSRETAVEDASDPLSPQAPAFELRSPDEITGRGFFSPPPPSALDTEPLRLPTHSRSSRSPDDRQNSRRFGPPPPTASADGPRQLQDEEEDSALPWARSPSPPEEHHTPPVPSSHTRPPPTTRASATSDASAYSRRSADAHASSWSGMSSSYSRSRYESQGSAFRYMDQAEEDERHPNTLSDEDYELPNVYAHLPHASSRGGQPPRRPRDLRQMSRINHAAPGVNHPSHIARQSSDASSGTTGTLSSSAAHQNDDDSASSPEVAYPSTPGTSRGHADPGSSHRSTAENRSGKKKRDYTSIYDVYGRDSVAFPALAPWNPGSMDSPASPPVPPMLLRGGDPAASGGSRPQPRGTAPLAHSPLGLSTRASDEDPYHSMSAVASSRAPPAQQSSSNAPVSLMPPPPANGGLTPLAEGTIAGLAIRQKSKGGIPAQPSGPPGPPGPFGPMGPRPRPDAPRFAPLDTSMRSLQPSGAGGDAPHFTGLVPGQVVKSVPPGGGHPPGLAPPSFSPAGPRSAPPSVGQGSPLPSPVLPSASAGSSPHFAPPWPPAGPAVMSAPSVPVGSPPAPHLAPTARSMGPVDEFGFFLPPGSAGPRRLQEDPEIVESWRNVLATFDVTSARKSRKVKHMCRAGIPPSLRPRVWLFLANAPFRRQAGLFEHLCHQASTGKVAKQRSEAWTAIDADCTGLFSDHILFSAGPGQGGAADLAAVLKAYLLFNPAARYSRGLGLVAGWLLIACVPPEDTFWLLAALLRHPTLAGYYDAPTKAKQLFTDSAIVARLLQGRTSRSTAQTLDRLGLDTFHFVPSWLDALYVRVLPWNTLARIWDAFLFEGPEWLLRVAVALTSTMAPALRSREAGLAALRQPAGAVVGLVDDNLVQAAAEVKLKESEMRKLARNASKQVRKDMQLGGLSLTRAQSH